jgi:shikimate dehydrogenase
MKAIPLSAEIDFEPDLIINTSSAGVLDQGMQLPSNIFSSQPSIYDLSYATSNTPFMNLALSSGSKNCYDGIGMLIEQAALSFQIWTKEVPDTDFDLELLS